MVRFDGCCDFSDTRSGFDGSCCAHTPRVFALVWYRLAQELETNVAMIVKDTKNNDVVEVFGRTLAVGLEASSARDRSPGRVHLVPRAAGGLLHITVLIENMRREGFELMIGCPQVIEKTVDGERCEPYELVDIELPDADLGACVRQALIHRAPTYTNQIPIHRATPPPTLACPRPSPAR